MEEIQKVLEDYLKARVAGGADWWLSLWDENGVQLFPGSRANDMNALREITPARFAAVPVHSASIDTSDITITGEYAIAYGHFLIESVADGQPIPFDRKSLTVLKLQDDGIWKIYRDSTNSNDN